MNNSYYTTFISVMYVVCCLKELSTTSNITLKCTSARKGPLNFPTYVAAVVRDLL